MADEEQTPQSGAENKPSFWAELKRRKVMRVGITYAVVAWLIIQITATVFPQLGIPDWAAKLVTLLLLIGFPICLIITWAFELTPDGIKTTKTAREAQGDISLSKSQQRKRNGMAYVVGAAVPTLIFGALALVFYFQAKPDPELSGSPPQQNPELSVSQQVSESEKSIAVLPLINMSPDPDNAFFADGVQEDILTNLSNIRELLVISRSSTLQYRNPERNLKEIGEELGVRYIVEGSVRRASDQVLVTVQLIEVETDAHLWAANYNRKLDDIFTIQAEVAEIIAEKLHTVISPEVMAKIQRRPTENREAYDLYLKSVQIRDRKNHLEQAVALDPGFAEAWARLAIEYIGDWNHQLRADPELLEKAHQALEQAKRLGQDLPDTAWASSLFSRHEDYDFKDSIDHLLESLALNPGYFPAQRNLGSRYYQLGRLAEAQLHFEAVLRLEPRYPPAIVQLADTYVRRGMWKEADVLMQTQLREGRSPTTAQHRRASFDYLQNGDINAFLEAGWLLNGDDQSSDSFLNSKKALISRDLEAALKIIEDTRFRQRDEFEIISSVGDTTFHILSAPMLKALLGFELADEDRWSKEAEEARAILERLSKDYPDGDPRYRSNLAICRALQGEADSIDALISGVREQCLTPNWQYARQLQCEMHFAIAYLLLGDHDKSIEILEDAKDIRSPIFLNRELDLWFIFDRLRGDPRFDALLEG